MKKLIAFLLLATITPYAHANSAGTYTGGGSDSTVETRLVTTPVHTTLEVRVSCNGSTSSWTPVTADVNGDGKDVEESPEIDVGGETYRWNRGRYQRKTDNGWAKQKKSGDKENGYAHPGGDDVVGIPHP